ncbi:hypothetical protein BYT27DRAFT_7195629 [Phlegmacium glaucopus]|nr:hypothetical protein BYT27DRAFT_7195629 [Phlegmacium glaucopus]
MAQKHKSHMNDATRYTGGRLALRNTHQCVIGIDYTPFFSNMATFAHLATSSNCVLDTSELGFCLSVLIYPKTSTLVI